MGTSREVQPEGSRSGAAGDARPPHAGGEDDLDPDAEDFESGGAREGDLDPDDDAVDPDDMYFPPARREG
jgi:hypothetical protein